ncbi:MerR family transcriptional regulator [Magnetovibrio blakemorei]|uniref:MerR family transcriptional regulator n=1 Tax=Magnetovibrio blakemorei TaxID=28181 RepID=UPI0009FC66F0|nr:MerR family transcriptional regulator [Magnetovibrio blakemorei]
MDQSPKSERTQKSTQAFRTISEVADELDLPQHVLRFWETKFKQISPMKRGGGRRYYRPEDVELLRAIKALLHFDGYTIKGVQKLLSSGGLNNLSASDTTPAPVASVEAAPADQAHIENNRAEPSLQPSFDLAGLAVLVRELEDIRDHLKKSVS